MTKAERIKINVGNFELIEISPEVNYYHKFLHREVNIFDKQNNIIRTYKSFTNNEQFIINDVLFIIESLKKVPDWDIFLKLSNIPNLEKQISKMEVEIDKLKMKIAELKMGVINLPPWQVFVKNYTPWLVFFSTNHINLKTFVFAHLCYYCTSVRRKGQSSVLQFLLGK